MRNQINNGLEIRKKKENKEYTLVWLEDSPEFDKRIELPTLGEVMSEGRRAEGIYMGTKMAKGEDYELME